MSASLQLTKRDLQQAEIYYAKYGPVLEKEQDREAKRQLEREKSIIADDKTCPVMTDSKMTPDDVRRLLQLGFDDANALTAIGCSINQLSLSDKYITKVLKIKRYLGRLKQIGEESVNGYAMLDDNDLFVIKSPKRVNDADLQLHEYFVGVYGTNTLRNYVPNFAYIYSMFDCSTPYIADKRSKTYCQNDREVKYIVYENVKDSVSLKRFLRACDFDDVINIMSQIILALHMAHQEFDFTHYDLHAANILIRELPEPIDIDYSDVIIRTRYVATIIDFGESHIMLNGEHYGRNMPVYRINRDKSYIMYDVYTLVVSILGELFYEDRYDVASKLLASLNYFSVLDNLEFMKLVGSNDYTFPPGYERLTAIDYWNRGFYPFFKGVIDTFIVTEPVNLYGCVNSQDGCGTVDQFLSINSSPMDIDNPYDYAELIDRFDDDSFIELGNKHYNRFIDRLIDDFEREYDELAVVPSAKDFNIPKKIGYRYEEVVKYGSQQQMLEYMSDLAANLNVVLMCLQIARLMRRLTKFVKGKNSYTRSRESNKYMISAVESLKVIRRWLNRQAGKVKLMSTNNVVLESALVDFRNSIN